MFKKKHLFQDFIGAVQKVMNLKKQNKNNRINAKWGLFLGVVILLLPVDLRADNSSGQSSDSFNTTDGFLWGLVLTEALLYGLDAYDAWPIGAPLIGPSFDPQEPDTAYLLSDEVTPIIGKPHLEDPNLVFTSLLIKNQPLMVMGLW